MTFAGRLKKLREDAGLTGTELGKRVGVSKQTIAHWETGRYQPSLDKLAKLCGVFNRTADFLVTGAAADAFGPETLRVASAYQALNKSEREKWQKLVEIAGGQPLTDLSEPNDQLLGGDSQLGGLTEPKEPTKRRRR